MQTGKICFAYIINPLHTVYSRI